MSVRIDQADHITAFRDAMAKEGIHYSGPIIADGKLHRFHVDGDTKGKMNGFYLLHIDEQPAGIFGSNKLYGHDHKFKWSAKGLAPLTREERAAHAARMAEARAKSQAEEAARHDAARTAAASMWDGAAEASTHPYLARKGVGSHGLRVGPWVKTRKDGTTYQLAKDALLVPMRDGKKVTWGLQAIFSAKVEIAGELRDKDFVYGARKVGLWHAIGKPLEIDGRKVIGLAEGYATAASVHEASGLGVLVCFDAGNLLHVAREVRRIFPDARLVFFADNDQWTMIRDVPTNVGMIKATDAAATVKGEVVAPWFADVSTKPTDWNDLACLQGAAEVKRQVMAAIAPAASLPAVVEEPPPPEGADDYGAGGAIEPVAAPGQEEKPKRKPRAPKEPFQGNPDSIRKNGWFTILGHDRHAIYVFQHEKRMITARGEADWSGNALITLAPPDWWAENFGVKGKLDKDAATNAIVRCAYERGYYDPTTTRGRGAWQDEGRTVVHLGDRLIVDNETMEVTEIASNYVYEQGRRLRPPADEPMSSADGKKIIETARVFHWTRPASAILCAGWVALAPLCGALRWRPHLWLTGGTGSGKSTILNRFIWPMMNGMDIYAQGNSTEAGIRQTLMTDALPVLFEETEQNDERERLRMQAVLSLIRQSSTESAAKTLKGSQTGEAMGFMIRSMFCLASVQVGMRHQADEERISVLALKPKRAANKDQANKNWTIIKEAVDQLNADKELPARLLRRSIKLLPTTIENIEIFAKAAADKFGSQREGDQFGAMLAGAWSLVSTRLATDTEAREMINRYDWTEYTETSEQEESMKALQTLLAQLIRTQRGDVSVYELLARCAGREGPGAWDGSRDQAKALLCRHGMKIHKDARSVAESALLVAYNHSELDKLMAETPYAADVKGQLLRVPGAFRHDPERFNGTVSRSVGIPMQTILDGDSGLSLGDPIGDDIPEF